MRLQEQLKTQFAESRKVLALIWLQPLSTQSNIPNCFSLLVPKVGRMPLAGTACEVKHSGFLLCQTQHVLPP